MVDSTTPRASAGVSRRQPPPCTKGPVPPGLFPFAPRRLASTIRTQAGSRGRGINHLAPQRRTRGGSDPLACTREFARGPPIGRPALHRVGDPMSLRLALAFLIVALTAVAVGCSPGFDDDKGGGEPEWANA